jgi:CARDB
MPLPDLAIRTVQQIHGDNGEWFYCPQVTNYGQRPSGGFALESRAGQTILRNIAMPALEIGQTAGNCILRSEIPQGQTKLSFRIDGTRQIAEMDEHNNAYEWTIPTLPAAVLAPDEAQSDPANSAGTQLAPTISAIRLNGKQPTGQSDCTIGKNDVTVTVRNGEAVPTDATVLRLRVDKNTDDAEEKSVASLDKGKSVDVSFEDIRLKKGAHTLTASFGAESETTEPKKDGNELSVSVTCKEQGD